MKRTIFVPVFLTFLLLISACSPTEVIPENKATEVSAQEGWQRTALHFFERLEAYDKDNMQAVFRSIDRLSTDNSKEECAYLKGVIEGINHALSPYYILTCSAPQEMTDLILNQELATAFERAFDAETAFISAIQTNVYAPALTDASSDLHTLMPDIWKALESLYHYNLYAEDLNQKSYGDALLAYAALLEDAAVLLAD